jgi:K(+)-stimulated pyrophosphate-energized sodium pump
MMSVLTLCSGRFGTALFHSGRLVIRQDAGDDRMRTIAGYIADGAIAFPAKAEYRDGSFSPIASGSSVPFREARREVESTLLLPFDWGRVSALAGFIGMKIATKANRARYGSGCPPARAGPLRRVHGGLVDIWA